MLTIRQEAKKEIPVKLHRMQSGARWTRKFHGS
jgi:hypothetical protein